MRVFVTGATGWVGSAVVRDLIAAGHSVRGLSRSAEGATKLRAAGAEVQLGTLEDLDGLKDGAAWSDGVIHLAFNHDFSKIVENSAAEKRAIEALGGVLLGSDRPLVVTSGVALLSPGVVSDEATPARVISDAFPRAPEAATAELAERGLRTTVVRLAPTVHGIGDKGFVPLLIGVAREKGVAAYVGEGQNRWPAVHRDDAARVFRLALEAGAEGGPFHAIAEEGIPMKQITEVIARRLNLPLVSLTPQEAQGHFGWFGGFAAIDCPASSERTRARLNWAPQHPGLLEDMEHPAYFG